MIQVDQIDAVILCTGFSFGFPVLEQGQLIKVEDNHVRLYKNMFRTDLPHCHTLAVLGLVQPLGSIMPIAEMQVISNKKQTYRFRPVFSASC